MGEQPPKKVKLDPKDFMFSNLKGQVPGEYGPCPCGPNVLLAGPRQEARQYQRAVVYHRGFDRLRGACTGLHGTGPMSAAWLALPSASGFEKTFVQVTIDYCTNCRIFLGPCDGSVRPSHARVRARRCMEACRAGVHPQLQRLHRYARDEAGLDVIAS